jgi:hypothetical protein
VCLLISLALSDILAKRPDHLAMERSLMFSRQLAQALQELSGIDKRDFLGGWLLIHTRIMHDDCVYAKS